MATREKWIAHVSEFLAASDFTPNTLRSYRSALGRFLNDVMPWKRGWEDPAIHWKQGLSSSLQPASVAHRVTCVRSFLKWCCGMGYCERNPMLAVKVRMTRSGSRRALTAEEVRRLLDTTKNIPGETYVKEEHNKRDRAVLLLMLHTGLRISGARMLDIEDFKQKSGRTLAYYVGKGHTGKDAFVVVPPIAMQALQEYLEAGSRSFEDTGPLFTTSSDNTSRVSESGMRNALNDRLRQAGLSGPGVTVHSLRHTAATFARAAGASVEDVQRMLDHGSAGTTEIYLHRLDRVGKPAEMHIDYGFEAGGKKK